MSKANSKYFKFGIYLNSLFQCLNKSLNLLLFIVNRERTSWKNNSIKRFIVRLSRILGLQRIIHSPLVPLIVKNACKKPSKMNFRLKRISSKLTCSKINYSYSVFFNLIRVRRGIILRINIFFHVYVTIDTLIDIYILKIIFFDVKNVCFI